MKMKPQIELIGPCLTDHNLFNTREYALLQDWGLQRLFGKSSCVGKSRDPNLVKVEFSPFEENKLACATSQNFGIIGNGRQFVFSVEGDQRLVEQASFFTRDGLYDCAW